MNANYWQPIGSKKKKEDKSDIEQIAFRMVGADAQIKRRFLELLKERDLGMKEVLTEFIQRYVEYEGEIGVMSLQQGAVAKQVLSILSAGGEARKAQPDIRKKPAEIAKRWYRYIDIIVKHASAELSQLVEESLEAFADMARKKSISVPEET